MSDYYYYDYHRALRINEQIGLESTQSDSQRELSMSSASESGTNDANSVPVNIVILRDFNECY